MNSETERMFGSENATVATAAGEGTSRSFTDLSTGVVYPNLAALKASGIVDTDGKAPMKVTGKLHPENNLASNDPSNGKLNYAYSNSVNVSIGGKEFAMAGPEEYTDPGEKTDADISQSMGAISYHVKNITGNSPISIEKILLKLPSTSYANPNNPNYIYKSLAGSKVYWDGKQFVMINKEGSKVLGTGPSVISLKPFNDIIGQ